MTIAQLIPWAITVSIFLTVFALGLAANLRNALWLFQKPRLLVKSILSLNVLMVVFAIVAVKLFNLNPAVKIAIIALAISPVPPLFPKKQSKVGATDSYAVALLVAASLFSIVLIPGWLELLGGIFNFESHFPLGKILSVVFMKILLPLFIGILVHRLAPGFAERITKPVSAIATVLLAIAVLAVLFSSYHAIWAMVGNGVLIAVALFALVGIAVGHLLGGPDPDNRSILALATSVRHPGIAITIAVLNFPERKSAILAVVLLHLLVGALVAIPYMKWRKKLHSELQIKDGAA